MQSLDLGLGFRVWGSEKRFGKRMAEEFGTIK